MFHVHWVSGLAPNPSPLCPPTERRKRNLDRYTQHYESTLLFHYPPFRTLGLTRLIYGGRRYAIATSGLMFFFPGNPFCRPSHQNFLRTSIASNGTLQLTRMVDLNKFNPFQKDSADFRCYGEMNVCPSTLSTTRTGSTRRLNSIVS